MYSYLFDRWRRGRGVLYSKQTACLRRRIRIKIAKTNDRREGGKKYRRQDRARKEKKKRKWNEIHKTSSINISRVHL